MPPVALIALTSLVSLTSSSPRTIATTKRPSPVMKKAALAVRLVGTSRKAARLSMVVAPGVSTSSTARRSSAAGSGAVVGATWRLDA